ncbi:heavy metal translocating P-type ATPase [Candidatus Protochlamydia amoebophila]|nr:heavy metal translocating P-type ATPase [Candidatus Protochlamydia amoebophila]
MEKKKLLIRGMHCVSCAQNLENSLKKVSGLQEIHVDYSTSQADIIFDENKVSFASLEKHIKKMGYESYPFRPSLDEDRRIKQKEIQNTFKTFLIAAVLSLPFVIQMLAMMSGYAFSIPPTWQFFLATLVQFGCGGTFYRSSFYALKNWQINMDVLVVLGSTAAYLFSFYVYLLKLSYSFYFESSALIITLILFGRWLEAVTKGKTSKALERLYHLQPKIARIEKNGEMIEVDVASIQVGDIFMVRPGDHIPVDGWVIEGESSINESLLTGESLPVYKKQGSKLYAATINETGYLKGQASSVGSDTILAQILRAVEKAQSSKAPIQKFVDKISAVFVPCVLLISCLTILIWTFLIGDFTNGLINAVSVLVIACPCVLGLATPAVLVVASGVGAQYGIFFKQASSIEQSEKIKFLFLDKTGTLTKGIPSVMGIYPNAKYLKNDVLQIAASLENCSSHPLAKAILNEAKEEGILLKIVKEFNSFIGKGITGTMDEKVYYLGSANFAKEMGIEIDPAFSLLEEQGESLVFVWTDHQLLGMITIMDELRKESMEVIRLLKLKGIYPILLTGDRKYVAETIAKKLGIEDARFELLPDDKMQIIREAKSSGKVGMIGDGINDAPALAEADVSFALAFGSDIAIEVADITLIRNDLMSLVDAIDLSQQTMRKMKYNLFLAFIYNVLAIPLAAFGLLNPMIAAGTMAMSSVSVIANALLLRYWKPEINRNNVERIVKV